MQIQDIQITSIRRSVDGKRVLGDVAFRISENDHAREMVVHCETPFSSQIREDALLVGDAIRQLRRLPEMQSGEQRLRFAPGLRPLATTRQMDRSGTNG